MLDMPDTNCARLVKKGMTSGTMFSFPVSPGEEEIEAEELDKLGVKLEIDYQIGEEGKLAFRLSLSCFPAHRTLYSCL
jgi:hypothetical protein